MKMKGLYTVLLAAGLLAVPMAATAQIQFSVNGGPTFSTFTGDDVDDEDLNSKTGIFLGAGLGFPLSDMLSFGTGAYFVQKGAEVESLEGVEVGLDYIEIPALLQVQVTGPDRPVGISLMAGPSFGFNLSCNVSGTVDEIEVDESCGDVDEFFEANTFDLGLLAGGGLSFATSETMSFFVNGGIDIGLTNIADFENEDEEGDIKNQVWFFGAGLSWIVGN